MMHIVVQQDVESTEMSGLDTSQTLKIDCWVVKFFFYDHNSSHTTKTA